MIFHVNIYYAVIIAWGLFYLAMSFSSIPGVPWTSCDNWWNTEHCYDPLATNQTTTVDVSMTTPWGVNASEVETTSMMTLVNERRSSVEEYWE